MKLTTKSKSSSSSEGWGMGFLFIFFPDDEDQQQQQQYEEEEEETNKTKKPHIFNLNRTNSSHLILQKAQSTISICLLLLFTTLLLFTLSALPSSNSGAGARRIYNNFPRRNLSSKLLNDLSPISKFSSNALQGMGTLYRKGTRAMNELIVAHAVESLTLNEFKLFIRLFYRSTLASRSDLLLVFPSRIAAFDNAILRENESFFKIVAKFGVNRSSSSELASFDVTQFVKIGEKEKEIGEPIWGSRFRGNFSEEGGENGSTRSSYGSVVGFEMDELDPENSLSGFMDHVPMSLRRWACYPMLLGRVKKYFKHVMLVDMKEILVLGDPMGRVRTGSLDSVVLKVSSQSGSGKHGRKNSDKIQLTRQKRVDPGIITGGSRGVRRLANAMLMEIVRAAMQHGKKKNSVTESSLFNQLVANEYTLKNVNLVVSTESVPELSSLVRSNSKPGSHLLTSNETVIRRGNSNLDVNSMVMKHICSFPLDSAVYSDC